MPYLLRLRVVMIMIWACIQVLCSVSRLCRMPVDSTPILYSDGSPLEIWYMYISDRKHSRKLIPEQHSLY